MQKKFVDRLVCEMDTMPRRYQPVELPMKVSGVAFEQEIKPKTRWYMERILMLAFKTIYTGKTLDAVLAGMIGNFEFDLRPFARVVMQAIECVLIDLPCDELVRTIHPNEFVVELMACQHFVEMQTGLFHRQFVVVEVFIGVRTRRQVQELIEDHLDPAPTKRGRGSPGILDSDKKRQRVVPQRPFVMQYHAKSIVEAIDTAPRFVYI